MTSTAERIAVTPAASPSNPSNQLTVFIAPRNQNAVSAQTTRSGKTICWSVNGLLTRSMKINVTMAMAALPSWTRIWPRQLSSCLSLTKPMTKAKPLPSSSPSNRVVSLGSVDGGSQRRSTSTVTSTVIVKAATMDTPPVRGMSPWCWRRPPGRSTSPQRWPSRPARGVSSTASRRAMAKTATKMGAKSLITATIIPHISFPCRDRSHSRDL